MKVSYKWLQSYFDTPLPKPEEVSNKLTFHSFEVEGMEMVGDDTVFDIAVLPNRAHDCLSHRGIAKEVSALFSLPLNRDPFREEIALLPQSSLLKVSIEDPLLCRRYCGAVVRGVRVGPSPEWLKNRLESIGQRSINNIVDATNYVMFSIGQPLHAMNADSLKKNDKNYSVGIRGARKGEKLMILSGEEVSLPEGALIQVSSSDIPIGIAGIKSGIEAEIDENTTDIVIESANFHPASVRKTSQVLRLRTDASTRFENELAPDLAWHGISEVIKLIIDIAGGKVEGIVDIYPLPRTSQYKIGVSFEEVGNLLGIDIAKRDIESIFSRLSFSYTKVEPTKEVLALAPTLKGTPYKYGASISYNAPHTFDCSSFVAYVFAQSGVSLPRIAIDQFVFGTVVEEVDILPGDVVFSTNGITKKEHRFTRLVDGVEVTHVGALEVSQEFLSGTKVEGGVSHCGIYLGDGKVIHASNEGVIEELLVESEYFKNVAGYRRMVDGTERYVVVIPFERLDLRAHTSFLVSGNKEDLIEEIGRIYGYEAIPERAPKVNPTSAEINKNYYAGELIRSILSEQGFTDVYTYAFRNEGVVEVENPLANDKAFLRKNIADGLQESLALNERNAPLLGLTEVKIFEIGKVFPSPDEITSVCLAVSTKQKGEAQPILERMVTELSKRLGVPLDGVYTETTFEFNLDKITGMMTAEMNIPQTTTQEVSYQPFSIYPFALRDIAVWVPGGTPPEEVADILSASTGEILVTKRLFDEYEKDGRISYAFQLVFQSKEKTLSEGDIEQAMNAVTERLNRTSGFEVR